VLENGRNNVKKGFNNQDFRKNYFFLACFAESETAFSVSASFPSLFEAAYVFPTQQPCLSCF
jgi:hypothetical protein